MIRFACGTCGRALRAPAGLAGKKGRCAHCGKVNQVPVVVSVDVRRATAVVAAGAVSPFRSTADLSLPVHVGVAEGIELAGPRFRSEPLGSENLSEDALDFLNQVSSRINDLADPLDQFDAPASGERRGDYSDERNGSARTLDFDGAAALPLGGSFEFRSSPHPRPDLTRVIVAALTVGAICGFCVGLLASKWMM